MTSRLSNTQGSRFWRKAEAIAGQMPCGGGEESGMYRSPTSCKTVKHQATTQAARKSKEQGHFVTVPLPSQGFLRQILPQRTLIGHIPEERFTGCHPDAGPHSRPPHS